MHTRARLLEIDDKTLQIDFGTYALIMYYAKHIDDSAAKKMFDATFSEYYYRENYDLPNDDLSPDDEEAHFDPVEIENIILFIDDLLVPALLSESINLLNKYGGKEVFFKKFYVDMGFLKGIGITKDEFYYDDPESVIYFINELKSLLQYALSVNKPHNAYVE